MNKKLSILYEKFGEAHWDELYLWEKENVVQHGMQCVYTAHQFYGNIPEDITQLYKRDMARQLANKLLETCEFREVNLDKNYREICEVNKNLDEKVYQRKITLTVYNLKD